MKYRIRLETTHHELFREVWDDIRQTLTEYSIPVTAERKETSNILEIQLKAKVRRNKSLKKNNIDGENSIDI